MTSSVKSCLNPACDLICAVIVTYHPDGGFPERARRIAGQVARVLIVDNGSGTDTLAMLQEICTSDPSETAIELIANSENLGIAAALNQGARRAQDAGFAWVLTFDQDSSVSERLAETCLRQTMPPSGLPVAMVGANYRRTADGQPGYLPVDAAMADGQEWMQAEYVITSGCLLSLEAYMTLGPFREDFFIDYVDIEYCFRARARGFLLRATHDCLMDHTVGAMTAHRFLRTWWVSNYPAWRWYYRARNLTLTSRAFFRREPRWVREAWLNLLLTSVKILLFEPDKAAKAKYIGRGLWRGLRDQPLLTIETPISETQ